MFKIIHNKSITGKKNCIYHYLILHLLKSDKFSSMLSNILIWKISKMSIYRNLRVLLQISTITHSFAKTEQIRSTTHKYQNFIYSISKHKVPWIHTNFYSETTTISNNMAFSKRHQLKVGNFWKNHIFKIISPTLPANYCQYIAHLSTHAKRWENIGNNENIKKTN